MGLVVADTSALVSLGTVADFDPDLLGMLLTDHQVAVPELVVSELRETAAYDDRAADAARSVLDRTSALEIQETTLDEDFPLDDGENAAVTLANDRSATQILCDEFNRLALVHASLADTRLVTTPTLLTAFVRNERLTITEAGELLEAMSEARSWDSNSYVTRAEAVLENAVE